MTRAALGLIALLGCADDDGRIERGAVEVTVLRDELPVAGAEVVFHDANGRVLGTARSDSAGHATGEITTWGMVTVADPELEHRFVTIVRVALGAALEVPLAAVSNPGVPAGTLAIAAPAVPPPDGTVQYDVETPCGRDVIGSLPGSISLYERCAAPDVPVLLTARTENANLEDPGRALAYAAGRASGHSFQPATWSTDCTVVVVSSELPLSVQLWPRLHGHAFRWIDLAFCGLTSGAGRFAALDLGEGGVVHAFGYTGNALRTTSVLVDHATVPAYVSFAMGTDLLVGAPQLVAFTGRGAEWTTDTALATADAIIADLSWTLAPLEYVQWRFVLPGDATAARVPVLPDDLRRWPTLDDSTEVIAELRYVEASWLDTLDEVHRELPLVLEGAASKRSLPRGGTLRDYGERFHPSAER